MVVAGAVIAFVGAAVSAGGVYWSALQQAAFEKAQRESATALQEKSEEIAALNERIANLVTGGDSFALVNVASIDHDADLAILLIAYQGDEFPLYDVSIRMQ